MLTIHEFLSQLVTRTEVRAAFQVDPQASLHRAGLEVLTAGDVLDAIGYVIDFAPAELVERYVRLVHANTSWFASAQQHLVAAEATPPGAIKNERDMERMMSDIAPIFTAAGDVEHLLQGEQLQGAAAESPVGSGNEINVDGLVGDIQPTGVAGDLNLSNGVSDVVGGELGDVNGLGDIADEVAPSGVGDITGDLGGVTGGLAPGAVAPEVGTGDATLPVEGAVEGLTGDAELGPVGGALESAAPVGPVNDLVGDLGL